jgi:hypothetical protein
MKAVFDGSWVTRLENTDHVASYGSHLEAVERLVEDIERFRQTTTANDW